VLVFLVCFLCAFIARFWIYVALLIMNIVWLGSVSYDPNIYHPHKSPELRDSAAQTVHREFKKCRALDFTNKCRHPFWVQTAWAHGSHEGQEIAVLWIRWQSFETATSCVKFRNVIAWASVVGGYACGCTFHIICASLSQHVYNIADVLQIWTATANVNKWSWTAYNGWSGVRRCGGRFNSSQPQKLSLI